MNTIDGKKIAQKIKLSLKKKISHSPITPGLGVILVGKDPASRLYVSLKEKACQEVGIKFKKFIFPTQTSAKKIIKTINSLNDSSDIHGILIQLPLPSNINTNKIISSMDPKKDVDGFHPKNLQLLFQGKKILEPVLIKAIWTLIKNALGSKKSQGLKCAIIGKSDIFTKPLEIILSQKGIASNRFNLKSLQSVSLKDYNIIIVAVGKPNFLKGSMFKPGTIIIDVGINKTKNNQIVGDVDLATTKNIAGWITPVPGGVGPVTVAMLLENIYLLSKKYDSNK